MEKDCTWSIQHGQYFNLHSSYSPFSKTAGLAECITTISYIVRTCKPDSRHFRLYRECITNIELHIGWRYRSHLKITPYCITPQSDETHNLCQDLDTFFSYRHIEVICRMMVVCNSKYCTVLLPFSIYTVTKVTNTKS